MESVDTRRRKRIVEAVIGDCKSAPEAIKLGNTIEIRVLERTREVMKFQQFLASRESKLAITKEFPGRTVLKIMFLDVPDQNTAVFIADEIKNTVQLHNNFYEDDLDVLKTVVRDKPQPQKINIEFIPKTSKVFGF